VPVHVITSIDENLMTTLCLSEIAQDLRVFLLVKRGKRQENRRFPRIAHEIGGLGAG
jgi:hypothetical protein